jgi:hypothetical protein
MQDQLLLNLLQAHSCTVLLRYLLPPVHTRGLSYRLALPLITAALPAAGRATTK